MSNKIYDLIIVGSGPAGLTAAIYAARYKLDTLVFGPVVGGMTTLAHKVCNYPGHLSITGFELAQKFHEQVTALGVEIKTQRIIEIEKKDLFEVRTRKDLYYAKKIILATGSERRKLNLDNEDKYLGKGISYCATCDAPFYRDKIAGVVGGSDAALTAALLLSEFATTVHIFYRKPSFFRPKPVWVELVNANDKIQPVFNATITGFLGDDMLEAVKINDRTEVSLDGLFVEIGSIPNTELAEKLKVELLGGLIKADPQQQTSVQGVFAAGDVTTTPFRQIVVAAGQGAIAASSAYKSIRDDIDG